MGNAIEILSIRLGASLIDFRRDTAKEEERLKALKTVLSGAGTDKCPPYRPDGSKYGCFSANAPTIRNLKPRID